MSSGLIHRAVPPCVYELEAKPFLGSETIVARPKSARRAWPVWSISTLALMEILSKIECSSSKTYPLKIPVDHFLAVDVYQPPSDPSKLG